jgi:hypothetical protein
MHPLPSELQLAWLRGDRLDSVATAEFVIFFAFDSGGVLQTTERVTLSSADANPRTYDPQKRTGEWRFHEIVGSSVIGLRLLDEMTLELDFGSAQMLIRSNAGPYEAGRVGFPDGTEVYF